MQMAKMTLFLLLLIVLIAPLVFGFIAGFGKAAWRDRGLPEVHRVKGDWVLVRRFNGEWRANRIRWPK